MTGNAPFERLHDELVSAASRQIAVDRTPPVRRLRRVALVAALLSVGLGAVAWAATAILATGDPVPYMRGAPIVGTKQGAPLAGTVTMLAEVADPDGGPAWGMRYWETDRKYACVQVGRLYQGKLGQITDGNVFHEIRPGFVERGLGGCFLQDGAGHAFVALHTDAMRGGQFPTCFTNTVKPMTSYRRRDGQVVPCAKPVRTVDFGLLGPGAKQLTYKAGGESHTMTPAGGVGAYLVVQRHIKPVLREFGFHHKDPKLNLRGVAEPYLAQTPGSQVITRVVYARGSCGVKVTSSLRGSCFAQAGFVPIPQPNVEDVRARVTAFHAPDGDGIRVRFLAREPVVDGRSTYTVEVHPKGVNGWTAQDYAHNLVAGTRVRLTVDEYPRFHGTYRIVVRYVMQSPTPNPLATPDARRGILVGTTTVKVP